MGLLRYLPAHNGYNDNNGRETVRHYLTDERDLYEFINYCLFSNNLFEVATTLMVTNG
jgi:hypothetical protein